jgi:flagellar protein FlaG
MDVQKLSGVSAASASLPGRPMPRPADASAAKAETPHPTPHGSSLPQVKLQLDIDQATKTVIGRIVDSKTGKVVRQIPTEEVIALKERSAEITALLDKKV